MDRLEGDDAFDGLLDADDPAYSSKVLLQGRRKPATPRPAAGPPPTDAPTPSTPQ